MKRDISSSWPVLRQGKFLYWVPHFNSISQRTTERSGKQSGRADRRMDRLTERRWGNLKSPGSIGSGLSALHPLKNRFMYIYCLCRQGEQFRPICVFELNWKWNTHKENPQTYTGLNNPFHDIPEKGGKDYTDILIWGKFYTSIFFPPCCNSGGNFNPGRFFRGEILYGGIFYATTPAQYKLLPVRIFFWWTELLWQFHIINKFSTCR